MDTFYLSPYNDFGEDVSVLERKNTGKKFTVFVFSSIVLQPIFLQL